MQVIREKWSQALHILDRFHIVSSMNKALDAVRAEEAHRIKQEGRDPVLKHSAGCCSNVMRIWAKEQHFRLRDLLRYNLKAVRAYLLKEASSNSGITNSPVWAGKFLDQWCRQTMRSRIERRFHARCVSTVSSSSTISAAKS